MRRSLRLILGVVAAVVFGGAWVAAKTFTGAEMGMPCNGDDDCKGMSSACVTGAGNAKYCTIECKDAAGCPAGWTCSTVGVTNIDGQGNMTEGGSTTLCLRQ